MLHSEKQLSYMKEYMKDKTTIAVPVELRNRIRNLKKGREKMADVLTRALDAIDTDKKNRLGDEMTIVSENIKKGQVWNKPLTPEMEEFEKETGKNVIYRGVITGGFEHWLFKKGYKISNFSNEKKKLREANKEIHEISD